MSSSNRIPFSEAVAAAFQFRDLFAGCYERWEIAGSIRRRCQTIGDVEHVIIPKFGEATRDLLGEPCGPEPNLIQQRAMALLESGVVSLHHYGETQQTRFGDRYVGLDFEGRGHELFMCCEDNWGCILAIRTGSAEFSRALVTRLRRHAHRMHGGSLHVFKGGECPAGIAVEIDDEWYAEVACRDEDTLFNAAGLSIHDWPPTVRTDEAARRILDERAGANRLLRR